MSSNRHLVKETDVPVLRRPETKLRHDPAKIVRVSIEKGTTPRKPGAFCKVSKSCRRNIFSTGTVFCESLGGKAL
jgi:hypothetical protein